MTRERLDNRRPSGFGALTVPLQPSSRSSLFVAETEAGRSAMENQRHVLTPVVVGPPATSRRQLRHGASNIPDYFFG